MGWLPIIIAIIKAVAEFTKLLGDRQLIERGKADAIAFGLAQALRNVEKANAAASDIDSNPNGHFANRVRNRYERQGDE